MGNDVFANGREVSCKEADGKSICAFPDVCFTPPENPATPPGVPIPYPNTGMASDMTSGSKNVKVSGKEVMLKNKSYFKKSTGDEAGSAAKKGVVTSTNRGKVYFNSWSMDVKFEGENIVRHLDLTTHNHACEPGQTPPWPHLDTAAIVPGGPCRKEKKRIMKKCDPKKKWEENCPTPPPKIPDPPKDKKSAEYKTWQLENQARLELFDDYAKACKKNQCLQARKCMLVDKNKDKKQCCPGHTGHHLIEGASFKGVPGWEKYNYGKAPTVCAEGPSWHTGSHRDLHLIQGAAVSNLSKDGKWSRKKATKAGVRAVQRTFMGAGCSTKCLEAQLNRYHDDKCSADPEPEIKAKVNAPDDPVLKDVAASEMGFT